MMWFPLTILAFLSIFVGYLGVPPIISEALGFHNFFEHYLEPVLLKSELAEHSWLFLHAHHSHALEWGLMGTSTLTVFVCAFFAVKLYGKGISSTSKELHDRFPTLHKILSHKYYVDELYHKFFIVPLHEMSQFLWKIFDLKFINGFINQLGSTLMNSSALMSFRSSGSLQSYAFLFIIGTLAIVGFYLT